MNKSKTNRYENEKILLLRKIWDSGDRGTDPLHLCGDVALELAGPGPLQGARTELLADSGHIGTF